jgi:hypothetical protein
MYSRSRVAAQFFGMTLGFLLLGVLMALSLPALPGNVIVGGFLLYYILTVSFVLVGFVARIPKPYRNELLKIEDEKWIHSILMYVFMALLGFLFVMMLGPFSSNADVAFIFGMYFGFTISLLGAGCFMIGRISLGSRGVHRPAFTGNNARAVSVLVCLGGSALFALSLSFLIGT